MVFASQLGKQDVMTGYDTGTESNHIALDLAQTLGYEMTTDEDSKARFQLPNGAIVESVGRIAAKVEFARKKVSEDEVTIECFFNVFRTLALPVLMGMSFLRATETLTKHAQRQGRGQGRKRSIT